MSKTIISPQSLRVVLVETTFDAPKGGGKVIPIPLTLSLDDIATLSLQTTQALNQFNLVQTIYVDNSKSTAGILTITFDETEQSIKVEPGEQGYFNVLSANPIQITFVASGGSIRATVILMNYPVPSSQWGLNGGSSAMNGIPDGGTIGQILAKLSSVDFDVNWETVSTPVNSDWTASSGLAQILNKPTLFSGSYNDLTNKPTIPAAQVNSDWNAGSGLAQILNKPSIPVGIPTGGTIGQILAKNSNTNFDVAWDSAGATPVNADWTASSGLAQILNKPTLFSGSYNDLTNKPTIPAAQVNSDWNASTGLAQILNKPTLFSGSYNDLTNKPTIPAAQVNSDWNASTGLAQILNKPTIVSASFVHLESHSASASAELDFTAWYSSAYDIYEIELIDLIPSTGATLQIQFSSDGGSTYDTEQNYAYSRIWQNIGYSGSSQDVNNGYNGVPIWVGTDEGLLTSGKAGISSRIRLHAPASGYWKKIMFETIGPNNAATTYYEFWMSGGAIWRSNNAINAFRVMIASGNIVSGTARVYGISH
jgi:hypothetical protein